jgi:hypothetical protein
MKLQLDTTNKTIKVENDIKISLLIKTLKEMLPNDWKNFTLQTNTTIQHWTNPIVWPIYYQPYVQPYTQPWYVTCQTTGTQNAINTVSNLTCSNSLSSQSLGMAPTNNQLKAGIYNVQI